LNLATVFSGIGAIEFALMRLRIKYRIIFACDNNKYAKQSYFNNYPIFGSQWYNDISNIDGEKYKGEVDLFVGGSPCQSFSVAGNRLGLNDTRGLLIEEFMRIVTEIRPKIFIYENVPGLKNVNNGKDWRIVRRVFQQSGYNCNYLVLNSVHYGIPQNRNRIFVVGFRSHKRRIDSPLRLKRKISMSDLLEDTLRTKNERLKNYKIEFNLKGDYFLKGTKTVDTKYFLSETLKRYILATGTKSYHVKPELNREVGRTLLKTMHKMHRAGVDNYLNYGDEIRRLTPRESLRMMGFDDRFRISVSDTQIYKQAGNSIVVDVLTNLISSISNVTNDIIYLPHDDSKTVYIPKLQPTLDDFF